MEDGAGPQEGSQCWESLELDVLNRLVTSPMVLCWNISKSDSRQYLHTAYLFIMNHESKTIWCQESSLNQNYFIMQSSKLICDESGVPCFFAKYLCFNKSTISPHRMIFSRKTLLKLLWQILGSCGILIGLILYGSSIGEGKFDAKLLNLN